MESILDHVKKQKKIIWVDKSLYEELWRIKRLKRCKTYDDALKIWKNN
jgi:hypothetical protein